MHSSSHLVNNLPVTIHYNGDYSGDIQLIVPRELVTKCEFSNDHFEVTLDFKTLAEFVADAIRASRISKLEQADYTELLNISEL
jgi:hypothetical protein